MGLVMVSALESERQRRQALALPPTLPIVCLVATVVSLALTALVGCSTQTTRPQSSVQNISTATSGATPEATPTLPITFWHPAPTLTLAQAWGNVAVSQLPTGLPDGEIFAYANAATPDGQWLVGEVEPRDMLVNKTVFPKIVLYNVHTRQIRVIHTLLNPQSRIDGASTDGHWLVWTDVEDPGTFYNFNMFVYNLQTGAARLLAQAPRVDGQPVAGPHSGPIVSNGRVIWSQPTAPVTPSDPSSLESVVVRLEDLSSGATRTLATSAGDVVFSWPWVAWDQAISATNGYVALQNLATGQRQQISGMPNAVRLNGASAIVERNNNQATIIADVSQSTTEQTVFATDPTKYTYFGSPTIGDRLLAWQESSGDPIPLVWDRVQHVTVILPAINATQATFAWTSGSVLMWYVPEPATQQQADEAKGLSPLGTMCVINTASLPTTPPST
jgi:hypothetical protein